MPPTARLVVAIFWLSTSAWCCCLPIGCGGGKQQVGQKTTEPQPAQEAPTPEAKDEPRPLSDPAAISFQAEVQAEQRAHVRGRTNLPPNTHLMVSVEEDSPAGFRESVSIHVAGDGTFQAGPFGAANGLPDGVYRVQVLMPVPRVQPAPVRQVIGEQGQHLHGPLVEKGKLGITVRACDKFTVGKGAPAQRARLLVEARQFEQLLGELDAMYKSLDSARKKNLPNDPAKYVPFAQQFRRDLQEFRTRMEKIPDQRARGTITIPWADLENMFQATAFKRESDYTMSQESFRKGMEEAAAFIGELREAAKREN